MSDYFNLLERELRAAVPRVAGSARPAAPRPALGNLAAAIGVAVALGVALLTVIVLGHGRPAVPARGPTSSAPVTVTSSTRIPTLGQLRANFAVLRRPQSAADRSWHPPCDCQRHGPGRRVVDYLVADQRLTDTLPGGDRVFLTVEHVRFPDQPAGSYSLAIWVVGPHGSLTSTNFGPNVNYTVVPLSSGSGRTGLVFSGIVPDGVVSVRWTFACLPSPASGARCKYPGAVTATLPVRGNVAAARVPGASDFCSGCRQWASTRWYDSHGQLVFSDDRTARTNLAAAPFVAAAASPLRAVLSGGGIAGVRFGSLPGAALSALAAAFGPPSRGPAPASACNHSQVYTWNGVDRAPGHSVLEATLTVFLSRSALVGYSYGRQGDSARHYALMDPRTGRVLPRPGLGTARGLTVGDTLADGRRLYGRAFTPSSAQGGSWSVRVPGGRLAGFADGNVAHAHLSLQSPISTIEAGAVGCPALSP